MSRHAIKLAFVLILLLGRVHAAILCGSAVTAIGSNTTSNLNTTGSSMLIAGTVAFTGPDFISDNQSNYWNYLSTYGAGSGANNPTIGWVANPATSATQTFTAIPAGAGQFQVEAVMGCSGTNTLIPFQQDGRSNAGASTFTPGANGGITALAGDLVVVACGTNGSSFTVTSIGNGFTTAATVNPGGSSEGIALFYLVAPSAAIYNPSITMSTNTDWSCAMGGIHPAGVGTQQTFGPTIQVQIGMQTGANADYYGYYQESCTPAGVTTGAGLVWPGELVFTNDGDLIWPDVQGNDVRYFNRHAISISRYGVTIGAGCTAKIAGQATETNGFNYSTTPISGNSALLAHPVGMAIDASNNVYVADQQNHRIFELRAADGMLFTLAGSGASQNGVCNNGSWSGDGGPATSATLFCPQGVALQPVVGGYLMAIADSSNRAIRLVNLTSSSQTMFGATNLCAGCITTIVGHNGSGCTTSGAGTSAQINNNQSVTVFNNTIYWPDSGCFRFFQLGSSGTLSVLAGNGTQGYAWGAATSAAEFQQPFDITFDNNGVAYLTDQLGAAITILKNGVTSLLAGNPSFYGTRGGYGPGNVPARLTAFQGAFNGGAAGPLGATPDNLGNLFISNSGFNRIMSMNLPCYGSCVQ